MNRAITNTNGGAPCLISAPIMRLPLRRLAASFETDYGKKS